VPQRQVPGLVACSFHQFQHVQASIGMQELGLAQLGYVAQPETHPARIGLWHAAVVFQNQLGKVLVTHLASSPVP
jgi:hypothetical protein